MLIAIEGPDGCGKTTQASLLTSELNNKGQFAIYIRPDILLLRIVTGKESNFKLLSPRINRTNAHFTKKKILNNLKSLPLFILGYLYTLLSHIYIKYFYGHNKIIVCDRYFYQFFYDICGKYAKYIVKFVPHADIIFYLHTDYKIFRSRQNPNDRIISDVYFSGVDDFFNAVSGHKDVAIIDNSLDIKSVNNIILKKTQEAFNK